MEENKSGIGSIIGTIIIIAIIILGGLYFWGKRVEENKLKENLVKENVEPVIVDETTAIKSVGSGDELASIETDLNTTRLDNLSTEVQ